MVKVEHKVWDSTKDLLPFSNWLPEVVGSAEGLIHDGSVYITHKEEAVEPEFSYSVPVDLKFKDANVAKVRKRLLFFKRRLRSVR